MKAEARGQRPRAHPPSRRASSSQCAAAPSRLEAGRRHTNARCETRVYALSMRPERVNTRIRSRKNARGKLQQGRRNWVEFDEGRGLDGPRVGPRGCRTRTVTILSMYYSIGTIGAVHERKTGSVAARDVAAVHAAREAARRAACTSTRALVLEYPRSTPLVHTKGYSQVL